MKPQLIALSLVMAGCAAPRSQPILPVSSLERESTVVTGYLGRPLGTVCTIEAVVVEMPPKMRTFGYTGRHYGLRVEKVDGRMLPTPIVSRFEVHFGAPLVRLAPSDLALDHLISTLSKAGQHWTISREGYLTDAEPVSPEEAEGVRTAFIGSRHTLLVYETAEYWGAPKNVPEGYGFVFAQPHEWHFAAHLVVFAEIDEEEAEPGATDNPDDAQRLREDH